MATKEDAAGRPTVHMPPAQVGLWANIRPFLVGGLSGCFATCFTQPVDTTKVRIQVINEENQKFKGKEGFVPRSIKPFDVARLVIKENGFFKGFYNGIDAAILRQILYCTVRLGLYKYLSNEHKLKYKRNLTMIEKSALSMVTGWIGSIIGNPADVSLIRFQSDSLLPTDQRRNYKNVFDALGRIVKEEGILALWRGSFPTIIRAGMMNMGMIAPYEEIKERLNAWTNTQDALGTRVFSSIIAGIVASTLALPPDNIKTKLQRMKKGADGKYPYTGFADCMTKTLKQEGITGFWVGLPTFMSRVCPHAVITLLIQDFFVILTRKGLF